ncbi:MAG: replication protein [Dehalococcoidia bacterium]
MASPQAENGHTDIANELLDFLCRYRMPGEARQVFDGIVRMTWGWHRKKTSFTLAEMALLTGMKKPNVSRALKSLADHRVISHDNDAYSVQKDFDKWISFEYGQAGERSKPLSATITLPEGIINHDNGDFEGTGTEGVINHDNDLKLDEAKIISHDNGGNVINHDNETLSTTITGNNLNKENLKKSSVYVESSKERNTKERNEIFDLWNAQRILVHRKLTDEIARAIDAKLKVYSFDDLCKAICNYTVIVLSPEYYWKHRWTLKDFLGRGIEKFLDLNVAKLNYSRLESGRTMPMSITQAREYARWREADNRGSSRGDR